MKTVLLILSRNSKNIFRSIFWQLTAAALLPVVPRLLLVPSLKTLPPQVQQKVQVVDEELHGKLDAVTKERDELIGKNKELLKMIKKNSQISLQLQEAVKERKVLEEEKNGFLKEIQQTNSLLEDAKMIKDNQADEFRKRELDLTSVVQQLKSELEDQAQQLKTVVKPEDKWKVLLEYFKSIRGLLVEIDCNLIENMFLWAVWVVVLFLEIGIFMLFAKDRNLNKNAK